jgi:hypothetical protein
MQDDPKLQKAFTMLKKFSNRTLMQCPDSVEIVEKLTLLTIFYIVFGEWI